MRKRNLLIAISLVILLIYAAIFAWAFNRRTGRNEPLVEYDPIYEQHILVELPEPEEPEPEIPRLVYVALGDSVSVGFGIWSMADRHTAVFFEKLYSQGLANEYVNLAVNGHTTTDLLKLLQALDYEDLETMHHATIITLNIGGNNIIAPFLQHLPDENEVQRIADETILFFSEAWTLAQELMDFAYESRETIEEMIEFATDVMYFADNFGFFDIFRLNGIIASASPVIESAVEVFEEISELEVVVTDTFGRATDLEVLELISLFAGTIPAELEAEFQASIRQFSYEFVEILDWLTNYAPDAIIIVNTVYNPLPIQLMGFSIGFANESARLIQSINRIIYEESQTRGLVVSDVYSSLGLDMMNFSFDIIHPNPDGHSIIAELNYLDLIRSRRRSGQEGGS